jgi:hypothetical protein
MNQVELTMTNSPHKFILIIIALIISCTATAASSGAHKGEQLFPLFTYRTGACENVGVSIVAGQNIQEKTGASAKDKGIAPRDYQCDYTEKARNKS